MVKFRGQSEAFGTQYIQAMEGFASDTGLLPEQVWDEPDRPDIHMYLGQTTEDTPSTSTAWGIEYVDLPVSCNQQAPIQFTFFWTASGDWEQRNYQVAVE